MPPNMRSVVSLVNRKIIRGGRSMEARRNFCSTPESGYEMNVSRVTTGWFVFKGVGFALGYGLGAYIFSDFGTNLEYWMKKKSMEKKKYYERIERLEKIKSRFQ